MTCRRSKNTCGLAHRAPDLGPITFLLVHFYLVPKYQHSIEDSVPDVADPLFSTEGLLPPDAGSVGTLD